MKTWNNIAFANAIDSLKVSAKQGYLKGDTKGYNLTLKSEICLYLADKVLKKTVSAATVNEWTKSRSTGPGEEWQIKRLETCFKRSFKNQESEENEREDVKMIKCSDFTKENIKEAYMIIMHFIKEDDVENEESYCEMRDKVEALRICMPTAIHDKFTAFIDENLEPIIYGDEDYFADMHTEEFGWYDEKGCFHLKDEEATMKTIGMYFEKIFKITENLERLGMEYLYPILTA